jgi:hypothetical protein
MSSPVGGDVGTGIAGRDTGECAFEIRGQRRTSLVARLVARSAPRLVGNRACDFIDARHDAARARRPPCSTPSRGQHLGRVLEPVEALQTGLRQPTSVRNPWARAISAPARLPLSTVDT